MLWKVPHLLKFLLDWHLVPFLLLWKPYWHLYWSLLVFCPHRVVLTTSCSELTSLVPIKSAFIASLVMPFAKSTSKFGRALSEIAVPLLWFFFFVCFPNHTLNAYTAGDWASYWLNKYPEWEVWKDCALAKEMGKRTAGWWLERGQLNRIKVEGIWSNLEWGRWSS